MVNSWLARALVGLALVALLLPRSVTAQTAVDEQDLEAVKAYLVEHVAQSKAGTAELAARAQEYYDLAAASDFDYEALWDEHAEEIETLLADARRVWVEDASANYELSDVPVPEGVGPRAGDSRLVR